MTQKRKTSGPRRIFEKDHAFVEFSQSGCRVERVFESWGMILLQETVFVCCQKAEHEDS